MDKYIAAKNSATLRRRYLLKWLKNITPIL